MVDPLRLWRPLRAGRAIKAVRAAAALAAGLAAAALSLAFPTGPALAFYPVEGLFTVTRDCPALHSIRRQENPGGVRVRAGEDHAAIALNREGGDHVLVEVPGAEPSRRWVAVACGLIRDDVEVSPPGADFLPIFAPAGDVPPPPAPDAFDRAVLDLCGEWGARPSRAGFTDLLARPDLAEDVTRIRLALGGAVRGAALAPEGFARELAALWFAEDGFRHVFCGEPGEDRLGGLHFAARYLQMQERGWGGRAPCAEQESDPPIHTIGIAFRTPAGAREHACPKSFALGLGARDLLIEATRAFRAQQSRDPGERMCLHRVSRPGARSFLSVFVARAGAIRTFYPDASPACAGGLPVSACLCER